MPKCVLSGIYKKDIKNSLKINLSIPKILDVFQVTNDNLVVHLCLITSRLKVVNIIQVGYVYTTKTTIKCIKIYQRSETIRMYLVLGAGHSEPYSWTCIPNMHMSTPSHS